MKRAPARGYAIAVASVAVALLLRLLLSPLIPNRITIPFFLLAIIVTGRWAGHRAAWLAFALGLAPTLYFRLQQGGDLDFSRDKVLGVALSYCVSGVILIWLGRSADVAREAAEDRAEEAMHRHQLLKDEIVNRQNVERDLQDRRQELELALAAGRLGTWSWDMSTGRLVTSESNAVIHGRTPDRTSLTMKESLLDIHADDLPAVVKSIEAAAVGTGMQRVAYRVIWPDGSLHWVEASGRMILDDSGVPQRALGVCADISDRKAADDALKASEARLQAILDNTPSVVYLKDAQGRYLTVNRRYEQLFHLPAAAVVGKRDRDWFAEDYARRFEENDNRVRDTGEPLMVEEVAPHDDGLHDYLSVKFPIKNEAGQVWAVGGISTDITEQKRAREALQTERELLRGLLDVQENEKQSICRDIHDGVIQDAAGALMQLEAFRRKHFAAAGMEPIDDAITSLRRTVNEGRRVIRGVRPSVLDDAGVLAGIVDLIDQLPSAELQAEFIHDDEIGRLPKELETGIYRVVQEALNNVKKHSGADRVCIEMHRADDELLVEVRDWGRGFDLQATRTQSFGLLGMSERVLLLGGRCSIESEPGAGTRIVVRLPIRETEPVASPTTTPDPACVVSPLPQTSLGTT